MANQKKYYIREVQLLTKRVMKAKRGHQVRIDAGYLSWLKTQNLEGGEKFVEQADREIGKRLKKVEWKYRESLISKIDKELNS